MRRQRGGSTCLPRADRTLRAGQLLPPVHSQVPWELCGSGTTAQSSGPVLSMRTPLFGDFSRVTPPEPEAVFLSEMFHRPCLSQVLGQQWPSSTLGAREAGGGLGCQGRSRTFPPAVCGMGPDSTCGSSSPDRHPSPPEASGKFHDVAVLSHA